MYSFSSYYAHPSPLLSASCLHLQYTDDNGKKWPATPYICPDYYINIKCKVQNGRPCSEPRGICECMQHPANQRK